jgi:hypothetical protein
MSVPDSSSAIIQWTHVIGNDTWIQVNDPSGILGAWQAEPQATIGNAKVAWQHFDYAPHFYETEWSPGTSMSGIMNANKAALFPWQTAPVGGYVGDIVTRYSIVAHYSATNQEDYSKRMPWSWDFQGSNNAIWDVADAGWDLLDTRRNIDWDAAILLWHADRQSAAFHFEFANVKTYRWYRIKWTEGKDYARIVQLMIWEKTTTKSPPPAEAFTVSPTTLTVSESAPANAVSSTATFTVVLDVRPATQITIGITSADTGEATVSPSSLTFTSNNFSTSQTVTVTGIDDALIDGDQTTAVTVSVTGEAQQPGGYMPDPSDPYPWVHGKWLALADQIVNVITTDDDVLADFIFNKTTATVSESGTTDTITISLSKEPKTNVVLNVVSADTGEVTVSPATLTFTSANWNTAQTLTVTGVQDNIEDGTQTTSITISVNAALSDDQFDPLVRSITVTTTPHNLQLGNPVQHMGGVGGQYPRSGGFPHLYRTDVSGAPIDASAVRSVARCDVAELQAEITPSVAEEQEHHLVNIAAKRALTVTEFKQMFYARGDDKFSLANVYECQNLQSNILASVWGKRVSYAKQGPGTPTQHFLGFHASISGTSSITNGLPGESFVIYDAFGKGVRFVWVNPFLAHEFPLWESNVENGELLEPARYTDNGYQPAKIAILSNTGAGADGPGGAGYTIEENISLNVRHAIDRAAGYHSSVGAFPESHPYPQADLVGVGTWAMKAQRRHASNGTATNVGVLVTSRVNSSNPVQRVDISDQRRPQGPLGTAGEQRSTYGIPWGTHAANVGDDGNGGATTVYGRQTTPYNDSRVMNYNKLGGRPNDPSGVDLAYGYATDLQRNFYAQFEVMGNLERDLCVKRDCWTLCSRLNIEDQLYGLSFVAETCDDVCMKVTCSRKWGEVEDALAESCIAENNTIGWGDYVDLYINVRVTNANPKAVDTLLRIRFSVQITRGPDDLGNWNVVASDAADAVLTTGVPYDAFEGGNLQYRNAAQTEIHPDYMNQQQTQRWDSTRVHNTNQKVDPHDVVGNP